MSRVADGSVRRPGTSIYYVGSIGEQRRLEAFRITPGGPHASVLRRLVPRVRAEVRVARLGQERRGLRERRDSATASRTSRFGCCPRAQAPTASGTGNAPFYDKATQNQVTVQPYLRPAGWKTAVHGGSTAGLFNTSQRLNAVRVDVNGQRYSGGVQVSAKVEGDGWRS